MKRDEYLPRIIDKTIEKYLIEMDAKPTKLGDYCEHKSPSKCKYCKICFDFIPKYNSSLSYMGGSNFKDESGTPHKGLELINEGYIKLKRGQSYLFGNNQKQQIVVIVIDVHVDSSVK